MNVLFLCTGNACRSQMAEGWANALCAGTLTAVSAGTSPHGLNPLAVKVMAEAGIDISAHRSKHIDEFAGQNLDAVVTVCDHAHEACPVFPGATRTIHHAFQDPPRLAAAATTESEALPHYRRVRDEIKAFILTLPSILDEEPKEPHDNHA